MGAEALTVEDRILLHLQNYVRFADDYEVPKAMSQKGIGEAVWIAWSNVPRAMKRLKETDLVDEHSRRVKGEFRKKKVYVLTPKGFGRAKELKEELGQRRISIVREGEAREMSFGDVPEFVGFKLPYLELLRGIDVDSVLDIDKAFARWEEKVEMVDMTDRAPRPREFVGREEELETLHGMLGDHRFVVLHGIAGIGKTTLTVRCLEELRKGTNVFWTPLHHWDTLSGVLGALASFLAATGRRQTATYLEGAPAPDLSETFGPLYEDLQDLKGVLIFDDFHKAPPPVVDLFSMLLEIIQDRTSPTLLLVSRYQPAFYDRRYVVVRKVVGELHLGGLDRASARSLLEGRGITDEEFEEIYTTTQGHPLALELLRDAAQAAPYKDVMAFVREEVFEGLTEEERRTLSVLSVYRGSVPRDAALAAAARTGPGPEVMDRLADRGLLVDVGEDQVDLHDLVREFFIARLTKEEREAYHRDAADAWDRHPEIDGTVERSYHLLQAGETAAAVAALAARSGEVLREPRLLRDVLGTLHDATEAAELSVATRAEADLLRANALAALDQADEAQTIYTRLLDQAVTRGEAQEEARILHRVGLLHAQRGQGDLAIEVQRRALAAFQDLGDEAGEAHSRMAIADVLSSREETEEALKELGMALESFTLVEDRQGIAMACTGLGSLHLDLENTGAARDFLRESLDNLDPKEDMGGVGRVLYLLGEVDRMEENWEGAVDNYERSLELFMTVGEETMVANACNNLGDAYLAIGDEERANLFYQRGMDLMVVQ
jgi:ATP/maltotriose-dependent transcriptional regulator MalT